MLESEVATTASLRPLKAHDLLVSHFDGGVRIIDGDTAKTVAQFYTSRYANFAILQHSIGSAPRHAGCRKVTRLSGLFTLPVAGLLLPSMRGGMIDSHCQTPIRNEE